MSATAIALQDFATLDDADCDARIRAAKQKLGDRCVVLERTLENSSSTARYVQRPTLAGGVA